MALREKLKVANQLYTKAHSIELEVYSMIQKEMGKYDAQCEYDIDQVTEYFNHVMNDEVDLAEMLILRDILNVKIETLMKR